MKRAASDTTTGAASGAVPGAASGAVPGAASGAVPGAASGAVPIEWVRIVRALRSRLRNELSQRPPSVSRIARGRVDSHARGRVDSHARGRVDSHARGRVDSHARGRVDSHARDDNAPFRVLVATMISLRTKDEVTAPAAARLLRAAPDPARLARMEEERIGRLIYPAGFYRTKAAHLRRTARLLLEEHGGRVPDDMETLLRLPGVGRKTANLVRNLGFGLPAICVDTHVHRISNRTGWVATRSAEETERALMEILPRRYWIPINELLVKFGQTVCTPLSPWCGSCPIVSHCARAGVARSR